MEMITFLTVEELTERGWVFEIEDENETKTDVDETA